MEPSSVFPVIEILSKERAGITSQRFRQQFFWEAWAFQIIYYPNTFKFRVAGKVIVNYLTSNTASILRHFLGLTYDTVKRFLLCVCVCVCVSVCVCVMCIYFKRFLDNEYALIQEKHTVPSHPERETLIFSCLFLPTYGSYHHVGFFGLCAFTSYFFRCFYVAILLSILEPPGATSFLNK